MGSHDGWFPLQRLRYDRPSHRKDSSCRFWEHVNLNSKHNLLKHNERNEKAWTINLSKRSRWQLDNGFQNSLPFIRRKTKEYWIYVARYQNYHSTKRVYLPHERLVWRLLHRNSINSRLCGSISTWYYLLEKFRYSFRLW